MKHLMAALAVCLAFTLSAQKIGDPYKTARERLKEGIDLYEEQKFEEALKAFERIHRCDSLYYLAVYEKALTFTALKKYEEAISCCREGLRMVNPEQRGFYDLIGSAFDYREQYDSAIYYYDQGLKKYPHYHKLYFEKAVSQLMRKNDAEALPLLIQSVRLNPIHPGTHLQLANLAARNGHYTAAMLAYQYYIAVEGNSRKSVNGLSELEKVCNNTVKLNDKLMKFPAGENSFAELDEIIKSRAAQIAGYKSKTSIPFTDITKQCQLVSERFKYDPDDKGFYNQFYGKLFSEVYRNKLFEASMYAQFSGVETEKMLEITKKNTAEIKKFNDFFFKLIDEYRKAIPYTAEGKTVEGERGFFQSGNLSSVGKTVNGKKTGTWLYFSSMGYLLRTGEFSNDLEQGVWTHYTYSGAKQSEVTFRDGKKEGPYKIYHENGQLREQGNYKNNSIDGKISTWFSNGAPKDVITYANGLPESNYELNDRHGVKSATATYVAGKLQGKVINYYNNGNIYKSREFKDGSEQGPMQEMYDNGQVYATGMMAKGEREGEWIWYYRNGKPMQKGSYKDGQQTGFWTDYYDNGAVKATDNYKKGLAHGEFRNYTRDGRLFSESVFKEGKLSSLKYYDENKNPVYDFNSKKGDYPYKTYFRNGALSAEGQVVNHKLDGKFQYYYMNGTRSRECSYKDGELDGLSVRYYYNGQPSEEAFYRAGQLDGFFKTYYSDGTVSLEGYYANGRKTGPHTDYYKNGKPKSVIYYVNNESVGFAEYFDVKGRLEQVNYYDNIYTHTKDFYDSTATLYQTISLKVSGECERKHPRLNSVCEKYSHTFGSKHGSDIEYFPNGKIRQQSGYHFGELHGARKTFDLEGHLVQEANFFYGDQDGLQRWLRKDGTPDYTEVYRDGKLNGPRTWYHLNGKVQCMKYCRNGEPDSITEYYGEEGTLALRLLYDDGVLVAYTHLDRSGQLLPLKKVKNETAEIISYYPNGNKGRVVNFVNGLVQGKRLQYYTNGQLCLDADFKDDDYHGQSKEYYQNGKLRYDISYKNGERDGYCRYYYDNGQIESESFYVCGEKYGPEKRYGADGKLTATVNWANGVAYTK